MAVIPMKKYQIIVHNEKKQKLLHILQEAGIIEIVDQSENDTEQSHRSSSNEDVDYKLAEVRYAIEYLKPYHEKEKKSPRDALLGDQFSMSQKEIDELIKSYHCDETIENVKKLDENLVHLNNRFHQISEEEKALKPWKKLHFSLSPEKQTQKTRLMFGEIQKNEYDLFLHELHENTHYVHVESSYESLTHKYLLFIFLKEEEDKIHEICSKYKLAQVEIATQNGTPAEEIKNIESEKKKLTKEIEQIKKDLTVLAKETKNLKVMHDHFQWRKDEEKTHKQCSYTNKTTILEGWIPEPHSKEIQEAVEKEIPETEWTVLETKEDDKPPLLISNNGIIEPFESVTNVYGLPKYNEVDPTPYLSVFFIVFFGMCLSDAGYGIILFSLTFFVSKYFNLPASTKKFINLLMYGGIATFLAGVIYGGWFGMTTEQAPGFLITIGQDGSTNFIGQIFKPIQDPISILLLAITLGVIQVMVGIAIDFYWKIKQRRIMDAFLDSGTWIYFLGSFIFFVLTKTGLIAASLSQIAIYMIYSGIGILILTQGRAQKGIIAKLGIGILSLYNIVGYVSDILSYSRLLALGLATGIIALAINIIALLMRDMIPYVGWILMIIVLIGGHIFNLAISTLGAFIHSARLQFVEFFGKFMEGGGRAFSPFKKTCKYLKITS